MHVKVVSSTDEYRGKNFQIKRVSIRWPNGKISLLDILEHPGSAVIIPISDDGKIHFVRQYRHATGKDVLELPAGTRDPNETFEACAEREIREETGMEAGRLQKVGEFYLAPGYSSEFTEVFLATDLKENPLDADEDEFLQVARIPVRKADEMFQSGKMLDAKSLAAWLLARPHLEKYFG
jgi:8-oxo-dGTP pyrophosphatase MutT (NUDIX family)